MNIRHIEIFHAVMTNGTASRAAETLRISQPAVSKAIQQLERDIGFKLFLREKGRIIPTAEGLLFGREVETYFTGMVHLSSSAARIRDFGSGEIHIASLSALSTTIMPKAIGAFRRRHPEVAITFQARMSSVVKDLVASGQFDVGLAGDEVDVTGVKTRLYCRHRVGIAVPSGHPLEALETVRPEDLDGQTFIALNPEDTARRAADRLFQRLGVKPKVVLETSYSTTICALVQAGIGVGMVHPLTTVPYAGRGLTLKPFEGKVYFNTLLLLPLNRRPSRIVSDFLDELTSFAKFET